MPIPREEIPWFPTIDPEKCTNCGVCRDFCRYGVYADGPAIVEVAAPFACVVGCSHCTTICPAGAIGFPTEDELLKAIRGLREKYGQTREG